MALVKSVMARFAAMKRGFLFGVGSNLIFGAIWLMRQPYFEFDQPSMIFVTLNVLSGVAAIYFGTRAGPGRSLLHTAFGWILGFVASFAVYFVVAGIMAALLNVARS
jgi:hypothetical protein